eukprot:53807-Chlamydomonas_euryale.AAC.1
MACYSPSCGRVRHGLLRARDACHAVDKERVQEQVVDGRIDAAHSADDIVGDDAADDSRNGRELRACR